LIWEIQVKYSVKISATWSEKIKAFWDNNLPVLEVEERGSNIVNGIAAAYYGNSNVGAAIHQCKYEKGGPFPEFLLRMVVKAFNRSFKDEHFDLIVFVPPTESGKLVEEFAGRLSKELEIPLSRNLIKIRPTQPQKIYEPKVLKRINVSSAFDYSSPSEVRGKSVLLFDDICDSGATIKEIGRLLTRLGAVKITPLVIAKTVGGDLDND